jgi:diguanylate cyclase (GGDEF)-like protein
MADTQPEPLCERLYESAQTRVCRVRLPEGSVIRKEPLGPDRERRLRHERMILEKLAAVPGVVHLAPVTGSPGSIFMEDVDGEALTRLRAPLDAPEVARLARDLAQTVAAMHAHGVVHRDINPANVLLTNGGGGPYLIDFAFATTFTEVRPGFTHHNEIIGTLPYLAPEQTGRTGRPVDRRADLYALGATLYELATGTPPFGTGDPLQLIHDHLARVPPPPAVVNPAVGTALSDIIMRLLEKEPDNRYQSAEGLVHDLRSVDGTAPQPDLRLGERDFPLRLLPPSRLVGRESEIALLTSSFTEAMSARGPGVLISGTPGVGKTSLINELRPVVTATDGWFVAGKFDQYRRDQEFDAVWQAFHTLGRLLLAEPEEKLTDLRVRLRRVLGTNAGLMAALHPEIGTVLRVTPDRAIGDPLTLQARLARLNAEILREIASAERPVVLALDDLQWAGRAPLAFVDQVMSEPAVDGLLLVAAYRENDLDDTHPLTALLSRWRRLEMPLCQLRLENLPPESLTALLVDMLRLAPDRAAELAAMIAPLTRGNPYDTVELLRSMRHNGLLVPADNGWRWDTPALRHRLAGTSVANLLSKHARAMPPRTRNLLETMACLGGRVEVGQLQIATGTSAAQVEQRLLPALEAGLLVLEPGDQDSVRFRHDRVQEGIIGLLDPGRQRTLRLNLARRLATRPDLFAVAAEQYLPVIDAVRDPSERTRVAALLRRAAEQAQLLGSYPVVDRCLAAALELTDPADRTTRIEMLTGRHAALYHLGRLDTADEIYRQIDRSCTTATERADATAVQVCSLTNRNQPQEAIRVGLELLRQLGRPVPAPEYLGDEVDRGLDQLYRWVVAGDDTDDLRRPEITDLTLLAMGTIINRMMPPAYFYDHTTFAWLTLQAWQIWAEHGPGRTLVGPLSHISYVMVGRRPNHRIGHRAMRRILASSQARAWEPETSQARFLYALGGWRLERLEECVRHGRQAREGLTHGGDLQNACFTYAATAVQLLECAPSLDTVAAELESGLAFARRTGSDQMVELYGIYRRLASILRGEVHGLSLNDLGAPERYGNNESARANLHVVRALAAALFGDLAELDRHTAAVMPSPPAIVGTYPTALAPVLRALALAERARATPPAGREAVVADLDHAIDQVASLSTDSPANFRHLVRLVEAERAWAVDDFRAASYAFDAAARQAATRCRPWHRALILEHAARFHRAHGMEHTGDRLLADARQAYLAWGATAKVDQLDWAYPAQLPPGRSDAGAHQPGSLPSSRSSMTPGTFDLLGALAASQAVNSETSIDGLRERVVEVLGTMTGATDVHLLLWDDSEDNWLVTVPAGGCGGAGAVPLDEAAARRLVPVSAVRYAERTREPLVVGDATRDDRFSRDPYLSGLTSCSLLAVPIRNRGAPNALLILENRLLRDAFAPERLDGVVLVAGQLGVSLTNAMVYTSLERKVAERTEELARANDRLERLSVTDALTGLANRRRFEEVLSGEWHRGQRSGTPLALAMIDIDHFKLYNDQYGHVAGDRCLQRVAALLGRHIGDADLAARYGGEEFAVVMPGTDLDAALRRAQQLRAAVVKLAEPHRLADEQLVTVSVGVAAIVPPAGCDVRDLAEEADAELYRAKRAGRNRVMPQRGPGPPTGSGRRDLPGQASPESAGEQVRGEH